MTPIAGDDAVHRGEDVVWVVPPGNAPPAFGIAGEVVEHLAGEAAKKVAFVLEVDVEARAGNAGFARQPIDAEFGEAGAVAHQPFRGVQQAAFHLFLPLLAPRFAAALRFPGDRRHLHSIAVLEHID